MRAPGLAVGHRLVGGLTGHLFASVRLPYEINPAQRAREFDAGGPRKAQMLTRRVPRLEVSLRDCTTKSRSRNTA